MPYTPQTWADLPATTTPISAARLGVIESGIQTGTATAEAAVPKSTGTTKGDLFVATASGVITRLAVSGTNGNVLTEDSTQTPGIKWAPPAAVSRQWVTPTFDTSGTTYVAQIPASDGQYLITLDRDYAMGMLDGTGAQFFEVHLCLIQDSTGGHLVTFPGSVHWHGIPIDGLGQPQIASTPLSITYMKFIWLESTGGFLGLAG